MSHRTCIIILHFFIFSTWTHLYVRSWKNLYYSMLIRSSATFCIFYQFSANWVGSDMLSVWILCPVGCMNELFVLKKSKRKLQVNKTVLAKLYWYLLSLKLSVFNQIKTSKSSWYPKGNAAIIAFSLALSILALVLNAFFSREKKKLSRPSSV